MKSSHAPEVFQDGALRGCLGSDWAKSEGQMPNINGMYNGKKMRHSQIRTAVFPARRWLHTTIYCALSWLSASCRRSTLVWNMLPLHQTPELYWIISATSFFAYLMLHAVEHDRHLNDNVVGGRIVVRSYACHLWKERPY
jgi:hypothetical protein